MKAVHAANRGTARRAIQASRSTRIQVSSDTHRDPGSLEGGDPRGGTRIGSEIKDTDLTIFGGQVLRVSDQCRLRDHRKNSLGSHGLHAAGVFTNQAKAS